MPDRDAVVSEVDSMLSRRPPEIEDDQRWQVTLRSHGITPDTASLLSAGNIVEFLKARQETLYHDLRGFLLQMCEWSFEDTPSLADLVIDDLEGDEDYD
jgi:hypothetical protein